MIERKILTAIRQLGLVFAIDQLQKIKMSLEVGSLQWHEVDDKYYRQNLNLLETSVLTVNTERYLLRLARTLDKVLAYQ